MHAKKKIVIAKFLMRIHRMKFSKQKRKEKEKEKLSTNISKNLDSENSWQSWEVE